MRQCIVLVSIAALVGACASEPITENLGVSTQALSQENGMRLNGMRLNGMRLNGMRLNGMRLNGQRLNGMRLNGSVLSGYVVTYDRRGNEVRKELSGNDLIGTPLVGQGEDGSEVSLRIDSHRTGSERGLRDVHYYRVSVYDPADRAWEPACGADSHGRGIEAIPVPGIWDMSEGTPTGGSRSDADDMFPFGCRDAAIGECVEWGYKPWLSFTRCDSSGRCWKVAGADYHQTCTRLVRADFCGDGNSWTEDGTLINVYDDAGVQEADEGANWQHEAEWAPTGATCMSGMRVQFAHPPACAARLQRRDCGARWSRSTLVMTDYLASSHDDDGEHDN